MLNDYSLASSYVFNPMVDKFIVFISCDISNDFMVRNGVNKFHYNISYLSDLKKKYEPEPRFEPRTSGSLAQRSRSEVRIPVRVRIFFSLEI